MPDKANDPYEAEKVQMYNLGGEYPDLPSRLLAWPDYCKEVERANAAEARCSELEAENERLRQAQEHEIAEAIGSVTGKTRAWAESERGLRVARAALAAVRCPVVDDAAIERAARVLAMQDRAGENRWAQQPAEVRDAYLDLARRSFLAAGVALGGHGA